MTTSTLHDDRSGRPMTRRPGLTPIPFGRLVGVEMRKTFDTRAGFWLAVAIVLVSIVASLAVALWAPDAMITFEAFSTAVGIPMAVVLPMVAILSVTSEWSQRTGLTTFTLVPGRGRSIAAKAVVSILIGVVSMVIALGVGGVGAYVAAVARDLDPVWATGPTQLALTFLGQCLGLGFGFVLGLLLRSSFAAIVVYLVYWFVLPPLLQLLAALQDWFADLHPWIDLLYNQTLLYDTVPTGEQWAQLGATVSIWILLPLAIGLWQLRRAEVK